MSEQPFVSSDLYDEEYFRTACEGFDEFNETEGEHLSRRLRHSFELADVRPGMSVLDVGCGRGEILLHCMKNGIEVYGIDYAEVATRMSRDVVDSAETNVTAGVYRSDAKKLPFPSNYFDRVLLYDVVEHLYPWELNLALIDCARVLKPGGKLVMHTAPNRWYDQYAYPLVRQVRKWVGSDMTSYPKDPRAITPVNQHVHVNEQSPLSFWVTMRDAGFRGRVWLDSPEQQMSENIVFALVRKMLFGLPPFRWFWHRELFAVATKK